MCHHGRTRCPKWPLPVSQSPGVSQQLLSLQGDSPRSTSGSDPGTFQTTVSALKLEAYEILCMPCKNGISFTYGPSALLKISPTWFSKPIVLGAHLPSARPPGWGTQCASWMPNSLARTSCLWVISSWIWVFTKLHLCHSFPSCCGSFFMSLVAENLPARL